MDVEVVRMLSRYLDDCIRYHASDSAHMKSFLQFLARLRGNIPIEKKLLVYGYRPEATEVRTVEEWERRQVHILKPEEMIHNPVTVDNEKKLYADRILYDISATDGKPEPFMQFTVIGVFAEWILRYPPCPVVFMDEPKAGKGKAEYIPEKKVVEVTRGFVSEAEICHLMLREYAHYFLHEKHLKEKVDQRYDRRKYGVEAFCVSYAVCLRFGVQAPKLENIQPDSSLSPMDILKIFDRLDFAITEISRQIEHGPELRQEAEEKERKKKLEDEMKKKQEELEKKKQEEVDESLRPKPPKLDG